MKAMKQIKASGEIVDLGGHDCSLEQAQNYVATGMKHALIENAWTSQDSKITMFCNEEGLLEELAYNMLASQLIGGHIVGDVLIVENEEKDFG